MLICLIVGDVNFDYLLKAVSTSFSTVKLLFSFAINKYPMGGYLRDHVNTIGVLVLGFFCCCLHIFHPLVLASIHGSWQQ